MDIKKNRQLVLIIAILIQIVELIGQNNITSEICIIGETHSETEFYNAKVLDSLLTIIKPDLILVELDSSFFSTEFHYDTVAHPDLKESISATAIIKYVSMNSKTDVRPYDITGRNEFYKVNDYFNRKNKMYQDIFRYSIKDSISERDYNDFITLALSLQSTNSLKINTLKELNSQAVTNLTFLQQTVYLNNAINIVETNDLLRIHSEFAHLQRDFWYKRNSQMVQNILQLSENYSRIVIITGNLHKYLLLNGIQMSGRNYKIKEFWEY